MQFALTYRHAFLIVLR